MSAKQEPKDRSSQEFDDLMQRAQRGELTPEGFKRVEKLIAEKPGRGLPPRRKR
jgi:hypothetical protein